MDQSEELLYYAVGDPRVLHGTVKGEGFAAASLAVGEDADVEAVQSALNQSFGVFEDLLLGGVLAEDSIVVVFLIFIGEDYAVVVNLDYISAVSLDLGLDKGANTTVNSNITFEILNLIMKFSPFENLFL